MRKKRKQRMGRRLVGDLTAVRDMLRNGEAVERRFTVRDVEPQMARSKGVCFEHG